MEFVCSICNEQFNDEIKLDIHNEVFHKHTCPVCGETYEDELLLLSHYELIHNVNSLLNNEIIEDQVVDEEVEIINALEGAVVRHFTVNNTHKKEFNVFLEICKLKLVNILKHELNRLNVLKFNLVLDTTFLNVQNETSRRGFIARNRALLKTSDLEAVLTEVIQELILKITEHEGRGSGNFLDNVLSLTLRVHKQGYGLRGSSFIPLPAKISATKACINIANRDDKKCFAYAMLVKFLKEENLDTTKFSKVKYANLANRYNFEGIDYPVSLKDVAKFEKQNVNVSVNVFALDGNNSIYPLKVCEKELRDHTDLLMLNDGDVSHYVYIKDFPRLIGGQLRHKNRNRLTVCKRCLSFVDKKRLQEQQNWLEEHSMYCNKQPVCKAVFPKKDKAFIKFNKTSFQHKVPIVIYADFEASLLEVDEHQPVESMRKKYQKHVPNSYCFVLKSILSNEHLEHYGLPTKPVLYRGVNAAKKFVDEMYDIAEKVKILYGYVVPMEPLEELEILRHGEATQCYLCEEEFTDENYKVRDHDHLTGKYRGPACNSCNLNYKLPKFISIVFHNLSKYDAHFIIPELGRDNGLIEVIPTTTETFISFSKKIGSIKLRFLDSFRFTGSSLLKLVQQLKLADFYETKKLVPQDKIDLVLRKGIYCYDYIDDVRKFEEDCLPPKDCFDNRLNETKISQQDYEHACKVWQEFNMKTLGQYHDLYLTLDTTLLCDVFEQFRLTCFNAYGLDALHCYTSPGLTWQAMLKKTKVNIELMTDSNMFLMIQSGIRGGITQAINRNCTANNKYLKDYDSTKPSVYLGYYDANALYTWSMAANKMPYKNFKWINPAELPDLLSIPLDGNKTYILEIDFIYEEKLHDLHYDFPLFCKTEIPPGGKFPKLLTTLENKTRYVAHLANIQQAIKMGIKITKIHRAIEFEQSYWLKPYIENNNIKRANASSDFEKSFFKTMSNALFGKCLQSPYKHKIVKLISDPAKLQKLVSKPSFSTSIVINENLVAVCMHKTKVKLDKPTYIGMSILDVSKTLMYDFHYNKMVPFYGRKNIEIAYQDTDSFIYRIQTEDMYKDIKDCWFSSDFDLSDYPREHKAYDGGVNRLIFGKFKDETKSIPIQELVALSAKMYAIKIGEETGEEEINCVKKVKGIKQSYVKKHIKFHHYKACLLESRVFQASYNTIRSFNHQLYSIRETKNSLSPLDDKRVILNDGIHTLPYGHYSLNRIDEL